MPAHGSFTREAPPGMEETSDETCGLGNMRSNLMQTNQRFTKKKRGSDAASLQRVRGEQFQPLNSDDMGLVNEDEFGTRVHGILSQLCEANEAQNAGRPDDVPFAKFKSSYPAPELLCPLIMRLVKWPAVSRSVVIVAIVLMDRLQAETNAMICYANVEKAFAMSMLLAAKSLEDSPVCVLIMANVVDLCNRCR
jgi:hypothetical protein